MHLYSLANYLSLNACRPREEGDASGKGPALAPRHPAASLPGAAVPPRAPVRRGTASPAMSPAPGAPTPAGVGEKGYCLSARDPRLFFSLFLQPSIPSFLKTPGLRFPGWQRGRALGSFSVVNSTSSRAWFFGGTEWHPKAEPDRAQRLRDWGGGGGGEGTRRLEPKSSPIQTSLSYLYIIFFLTSHPGGGGGWRGTYFSCSGPYWRAAMAQKTSKQNGGGRAGGSVGKPSASGGGGLAARAPTAPGAASSPGERRCGQLPRPCLPCPKCVYWWSSKKKKTTTKKQPQNTQPEKPHNTGQLGGEMSLIIAGSKKSWNTQVGLNSSPGKLMETYFTSCNSALDYCRLKAVHTILFLLEIVLILYFGRVKSASAPR